MRRRQTERAAVCLLASLVHSVCAAAVQAADQLPAAELVTAPAAGPIDSSDDPWLRPPPPAPQQIRDLQDAIGLMQRRSVDFRNAMLDIDKAQAAGRTALAAALPNVVASATVSVYPLRTLINPLTGETANAWSKWGSRTEELYVGLSVPLIDLKTWHAVGTARASVVTAELAFSEQHRLLGINLASALIGVLTAERVAEIDRSALRAALNRAELARRKERLGSGRRVDVIRVEQEVAAARARVVTQRENLMVAREELGLALGISGPMGVTPELNLNALIDQTGTACRSLTDPADRNDVAVARQRAVVAARKVTEAKLLFAPKLTLNSSYTAQSELFANTLTEQRATLQTWVIGAALSVQLFDGGARYGGLRDTKASLEQAQNNGDSALRRATVDMARAARGLTVAEEARALAAANQELANQADELSRREFELGNGLAIDLIEAGRRAREAELALALREFELVHAKLKAILAASNCRYGGG